MTDHDASRKPASARTAGALESAPAPDEIGDAERVRRGRLAAAAPRQVASDRGHVVWDLDSYAFVTGDPPPSVHPNLWRQARLNNEAGLFEVVPGIYQVRGLDFSNATFIEGAAGWVVIDTLTSVETAAAAKALVDAHLGARPVSGLLYTHSHIDHFGGARGMLGDPPPTIDILAPAGFLAAAVAENVLVGTAMRRRSTYMYGMLLARDERGHVDTGLGKGLPTLPTVSLVPPTRELAASGEEVVLDGVRFVVQLTPDTEAPAEMNLYFPDHRALCVAENCTATLHNVYTPRGAMVRDALAWSKYIDDALVAFGDVSDVVFASHHWPRWGDDGRAFLASQRDLYRYVHDQTLRLANHGRTMDEIAEELVLPPGLAAQPFNHGFYGTVSHNAKAVYQRYLGYFDANPAHLHPYPPVERARRYVDALGGADAALAIAEAAFADGDYRWVVELVNHVVFADPDNDAARLLQADALEQLGYQSESGPWRDFYLTGALELRAGGTPLAGLAAHAIGAEMVRAMTVDMVFDLLGVRLNGPATAELDVTVAWSVDGEEWSMRVRHGALSARAGTPVAPDARVAISRAGFAALASGRRTLDELASAGEARVASGADAVAAVLENLDTFSLGFEIVLP